MCVQDERVDGFLRYFFDRMCEQLFVLQFFYRSDRSSVIYGQIYGQNVCLLSVVSLCCKNACNADG